MKKLSILVGKTVQKVSKLRGGSGSALPGLVIEKLDPEFAENILKQLPYGVVVVSGTNGKTTTTKIVTELLKSQGLRVFTNETGSNFFRGVISAMLKNIKLTGTFNFDIAVLELDEAHAVKFVEKVPINYALLLNAQRDQLDRFGEVDHVVDLLQKVAKKAKKTVVLNREDARIRNIEATKKIFFGLSPDLLKKIPSEDNLYSKTETSKLPASVILDKIDDKKSFFKIGDKTYSAELKLKGVYNSFNASGALALCQEILPKADPKEFVETLEKIESAFGRGEVFNFAGEKIELFLVKNPSAFQISLESFADENHDYMIAINDNVADGRDVSWLWDVDFSSLKNVKITSGIRASDMALRLKYDNVKVGTVEEDLETALKNFASQKGKKKRIFATYTAMLELRKIIFGRSIE
ncbi:DUF1727 domain-containing protein [Candidatus Saccharibacteria bacterium]|nr:DUF1727 domain-containing protein [Candidatus Saccharibacteria bacterium]